MRSQLRLCWTSFLVVASVLIGGFGPLYAEFPKLAEEDVVISNWHLSGTRYTTVVTNEIIEATPQWDPNDESPPLSARKAIGSAREMLRKKCGFKDLKQTIWTVRRVSLVSYDNPDFPDHWYWQVSFDEELLYGGSTGMTLPIKAVVLMDGKAVEPIISKVESTDDDADE